ncbi:MAG: dehydrogenase [Candidatus Poribacteria bacterium]|nr:MAG: dehydrogenase [Candidatus Poribacteria bacterium]
MLTEAHLAGHDSHGAIRVTQYCRAIRRGRIVPGAPIETLRLTPTIGIFDAHWNFGPVAMRQVLQEARLRAREVGLFAYGIRRCNHIGRLGHYTERAAREGFVAWLTVNSIGPATRVAPFGGAEGRLGTNPISVAFPAPGDPILIDLTTSVVAEGKLRVYRNAGKPIPEGWILDAHGRPSTDPNDFYGPPPGVLLPFGGVAAHKGFALSMMVELLSGTLTGAGNVGGAGDHVGNGVFGLLLDVEAFRPLEAFQEAVARFAEYVKSARPAPGFQEVILPGEPEARTRRQRLQEGIWIDKTTWEQLCQEAVYYQVEVPINISDKEPV